MRRYYETTHANVHRGVYAIAAEATERYEDARAAVARFIGARVRARSSSPRTSPRRSTWWPTRGAGPTCTTATPSCSPRWSTTPTSCRGSCSRTSGASSCAASRSADDHTLDLTDLDRLSTASSSSASPPCRTCSARSRRSASSPTPPTPPARCAWSTARQYVPHLPTDVAGARLRLLRLHRPQDARPHRHRRAVGPGGAARRHARRSSAAAR